MKKEAPLKIPLDVPFENSADRPGQGTLEPGVVCV